MFTLSSLDLSEALNATVSEVSLLNFTQAVAAVIGALASEYEIPSEKDRSRSF